MPRVTVTVRDSGGRTATATADYAIAAPVLDRAGRTIAALNISGQANRTPPRQMQETMLPALRDAARQISHRLLL